MSGLSGIIQKVIPRGPNEMILPDDTKKSVRSHMTHCRIAQCPSPLGGALFDDPNCGCEGEVGFHFLE